MHKFIHIDMDAFFASVEIRDRPEISHNPVAVIGTVSRSPVLATCNYPARAAGLRSAMLLSDALIICPDLITFPARMELYRSVSAQMKELLLKYTDKIEMPSLDEAYLDVSDSTMFGGSATKLAQAITLDIKESIGLSVSSGVAPLKFLSKIASDVYKPGGLCVVLPNEIGVFISKLTLDKIPGVGPSTLAKLKAVGLFTGADIQSAPLQQLKALLGRNGEQLWWRCQGVDWGHVVVQKEKQSVGIERTLPKNLYVVDRAVNVLLKDLLPELMTREAIIFSKRKISRLSVKVRFTNFQSVEREAKATHLCHQKLADLVHRCWECGHGSPVRLIGLSVGLTDASENEEQLSLFHH